LDDIFYLLFTRLYDILNLRNRGGEYKMRHEKLAEFEDKGSFIFRGKYGVTREYVNKKGQPYTISSVVAVSTSDNRILEDHVWLKDLDVSDLEKEEEIFFTAEINRYFTKDGEEGFRFENYKLIKP
jgi:hypothetical protein